MAINMIRIGDKCPNIVYEKKVGAKLIQRETHEEFKGKRVLVFGVPGPFLSDYPSSMAWGYDHLADEFKQNGIDDIYVTCNIDCYTLDEWVKQLNVPNIKTLPDGNSDWASSCGLLVDMRRSYMGLRSHRYVMIIEDLKIKIIFFENMSHDPHTCFTETNAEKILDHIKENQNSWYQYDRK